ncbi:MAG: hypothetical protein EXR05_10075 [Acetobacteraceae bacterium]|nr:hypothetical protein [Acetobacteraceae bacterium]
MLDCTHPGGGRADDCDVGFGAGDGRARAPQGGEDVQQGAELAAIGALIATWWGARMVGVVPM